MKNLRYNILYILLALAAAVSSCTKNEEITGGLHNNGTATVELQLQVKDETGTKAESGIQNVSVWVYDMNPQLGEDRLPVAYKNIASFTSGSSVRLNIPVTDTDKTFRFFAIANYQGLGKVYNTSSNNSTTELELNGNLTYKELSTATFDTNETGGVMNSYPGADVTMPYAHWVDVTLNANNLQNGPAGTVSPTVLSMVLFRPVAKVDFEAKITQEIPNKEFVIKSVTIKPNMIAVPVQGALFSDKTAAELSTVLTPSSFGNYSDFRVGIVDNPLNNGRTDGINYFNPKTISTTMSTVGSTFLYENHHGEPYSAGSTGDYSSNAGYDAGVYYMEINYSVVPNNTANPASSETLMGVCYIPLPRIVRNNWYNVDATFQLNFEGSLILKYNIENWTQVTEIIEFTYPTFTIGAVATRTEGTETVPDYSQPVMHYNNGFNDNTATAPTMSEGAFALRFKMEASSVTDRDWTVHIKEYTQNGNGEWVLDTEQSDDFNLVVCNNNDNIIKETGGAVKHTFTPAGTEYQIRVYPKNAKGTSTKAAKIFITYPASWLGGQSDELLINTGGGGTLWTNSGGERYAIMVVQGNDI